MAAGLSCVLLLVYCSQLHLSVWNRSRLASYRDLPATPQLSAHCHLCPVHLGSYL